MIINNFKNNRGFVMLFAVVLSSIILAVTLGVANVTLKELNFTTSARATNDAFFAADTGAECALYYDIVGTSGPTGLVNPFGVPSTDVNTFCGGTAVDLNNGSGTQASPWTFFLYPLGSTGSACARVSLWRDTSTPVVTHIISRGYSDGGDTSSDCTSTNPNRVERQIELTY